MSVQTLQKLVAMYELGEQNMNLVQEQLRSAGITDVPPALVASIARYYDALQRLSAE